MEEDCDLTVEDGEEIVSSDMIIEECVDVDGDNACKVLYTCEFCDKSFAQQSYLARHITSHTMPLLCTVCGQRFGRIDTLRRHNCSVNNDDEDAPKSATLPAQHRCHYCSAVFKTARELLDHAASHVSQRRHNCPECGRMYARKESMLQHLARKHPDLIQHGAVEAYPCSSCHRVFVSELSLRNHERTHSQGNVFSCDTCHRSFASQINLERHLCTGSIEERFWCRQCNQVFSHAPALRRHVAMHNGSNYSFECPTCCMLHKTEIQLKMHAASCSFQVQMSQDGFARCDNCDATFTNFAEYSRHRQLHKSTYDCTRCGRQFLRQANLDAHKCSAIVESDIDIYGNGIYKSSSVVSCRICNKTFRGQNWLKRHMKVHRCEQCGTSFDDLASLSSHDCPIKATKVKQEIPMSPVTTVKTDCVGMHVCPICGKTLSNVGNLNKHMQTHGEKREVCGICGKRFHLKVGLREHERYVHAEPGSYAAECLECGKRMRSRNSLYTHMAQFHPTPTRPAVQHICPTCGRSFGQLGNLRKHMLTHSSLRRYICQQCQRSFKYPEQLRRHEQWHEHGATYACPECSRKFVMAYELRRHIAIRHSSGGPVYRCSLCGVCCHHQQTMRRHLQRRHEGMMDMNSSDIREFIQSLRISSPDTILASNQNGLSHDMEDVSVYTSACGKDFVIVNSPDDSLSETVTAYVTVNEAVEFDQTCS